MKFVSSGRRIAAAVAIAAVVSSGAAAGSAGSSGPGPMQSSTAGRAATPGPILAATPAPAQSPELARGRALDEVRCDQCHDRSVHQRSSRKAKSFAQVRASVVRWDRQQGGALWRDDEVDLVTRYLNDRYYKFPCPASVCGSDRAQGTDRTVPVHSPVAWR